MSNVMVCLPVLAVSKRLGVESFRIEIRLNMALIQATLSQQTHPRPHTRKVCTLCFWWMAGLECAVCPPVAL